MEMNRRPEHITRIYATSFGFKGDSLMSFGHKGKRWQNNPERKVGNTQMLRVMRAEERPENARDQRYRGLLAASAAPATDESRAV
jgi:hypothetical protein